MKKHQKHKEIVEKKLGISPDYQYTAMRSSFWLKKNWHKNKFDAVKTLTRIKRGMRVLDLGTGSGNFELLFAKSVKHIYGIDYNDEALNFLKGKLKKRGIKNVTLTQADMRKLPVSLASKKYDLIISVDTIEHISKSDGKKLIQWIKKRLKKGGRFFVITPNYGGIWTYLELFLDKISLTPDMGSHQHLSQYNVESMSKMLQKNGLVVRKATTFNLFSFLFPKAFSRQLLKLELRLLKNLGCLMAIEAIKP